MHKTEKAEKLKEMVKAMSVCLTWEGLEQFRKNICAEIDAIFVQKPEQEKEVSRFVMVFNISEAEILKHKCEYVTTDDEKATISDFITWLYENGYKIIKQVEVKP